ncbi:MAG: hypothetical protein M3O46_04925 [Myxococcota bacterium]|nr:hypothetical protein [Myxococcota bacterium]
MSQTFRRVATLLLGLRFLAVLVACGGANPVAGEGERRGDLLEGGLFGD